MPSRWAAPLLAAILLVTICAGGAAAASEGHGIEGMIGADWKGMWGFEKRGFAECWLAGTRHQAARTLAELRRAEPLPAPLKALQIELSAILGCRLTPKQLEEAVNRFYEAPGNAKVLLGDALHAVVVGGPPRPR
jgi:hypothetical protein